MCSCEEAWGHGWPWSPPRAARAELCRELPGCHAWSHSVCSVECLAVWKERGAQSISGEDESEAVDSHGEVSPGPITEASVPAQEVS